MRIKPVFLLGIIASFLIAPHAKSQGELYPLELRRAFLQNCVGNKKELIPYCKCMIKSFEQKVSASDFAKIAQQPDGGEAHMKIMADYCIKKQYR